MIHKICCFIYYIFFLSETTKVLKFCISTMLNKESVAIHEIRTTLNTVFPMNLPPE